MIETENKLTKGILWNLLSVGSISFIQILSIVILGRLLTPTDFGLISCIAIFVSISNMIVDSGMGGAIIKKRNISDIDLSTLFFFNLVVSLLLYCCLFLLSAPIASFYNEPSLSLYLKIEALCVPLSSLTIVQNAILLKRLQFAKLSQILLASTLISVLSGILCAWSGLGAWSLIIQQISNVFVQNILYYSTIHYIPKIAFSYTIFKEQFQFGFYLFMSNMLKSVSDNILSNFLGKISTLKIAGYYSQENKLVNTFQSINNNIIDRSLFPVFSQIDKDDMLSQFFRINQVFYIIIFPISILLSLLSREITSIVLGSQWVEGSWMLGILALIIIPGTIQALNRNLLKSSGYTKDILKIQLSNVTSLIILVVVGLDFGVKYMIVSILIAQIVSYLYSTKLVSNRQKGKLFLILVDHMRYIILSMSPLLLFYIFDWDCSNWLKAFIYIICYVTLICITRKYLILVDFLKNINLNKQK